MPKVYVDNPAGAVTVLIFLRNFSRAGDVLPPWQLPV
jgi:hypothetical protein